MLLPEENHTKIFHFLACLTLLFYEFTIRFLKVISAAPSKQKNIFQRASDSSTVYSTASVSTVGNISLFL